MGIYHPKIKTRESPRGQPKMVLLQNKGFKEKPRWKGGTLSTGGFKENPGGKAEPCPREECEDDHFWKGVFENDT